MGWFSERTLKCKDCGHMVAESHILKMKIKNLHRHDPAKPEFVHTFHCKGCAPEGAEFGEFGTWFRVVYEKVDP